jgi:CBS domain containing-hemolysin-like protein
MTHSVSRTLFEMLEKKRMMGIVVDEAGNTVGMLTMEDVLEEIVGEIPGEFDQPEHYLTVKGPGEYVVDALIPVHELQLVLREPLKRRTAASLGGLLNEAFGHIPEPGESLRLGNYVCTVMSADKFRAKNVHVKRVEAPPEPATL